MAGTPYWHYNRQTINASDTLQVFLSPLKIVFMDLICFSHLRWNFVYQRPQHLLTRFAKDYRVFYIEEPVFSADRDATMELHHEGNNLCVVTPHLQEGLSITDITATQQTLLLELFNEQHIHPDIFWYYTPMALPFTRGFAPDFVVYDCMDELSNFNFAPQELKLLETELFKKANIVCTGGHNLYDAKKKSHHNIWPVPSSIDKEHFSQARKTLTIPADQSGIPVTRLGYYGVIDERMDIELIHQVALQRPDWQFVLIGPVVKIDPASLPQLPNIHYLGGKDYKELPAYLSGWDIALVPFLLNDATKYVSPTKTPEYLAAGKPVISTAIVDVVRPYGDAGLVHIVSDANSFIEAAEKELSLKNKTAWLKKADLLLKDNSWDNTYHHITSLIRKTGVTTLEVSSNISPLKQAVNV